MRSSSVLLMNASALAIIFGATPAFGQTQPTQTTPATGAGATQGPPEVVVPASAEEEAEQGDPDAGPRDADGSSATGGTITVTGSRIRLPNLESFEPTTTLDRRQVDERNITNVADALNELPGFRGSVTPAGAQGSFGQGVNFVNNYGMGSNRTLTLINGRRFVSSNVVTLFNQGTQGTQVDLNIVPVILLERIDTVSTGGAPVYGSDAISGTVNIILRSQYEGLELNALSGITEEGDAFRANVSVLGGWNFGERANLTVALSHDQIDGLLYNDRDFLRRNLGNATNPTSALAATVRPGGPTVANDGRVNPLIGFNNSTTDLNPGLVLIRNVRIPFLTRGGLITRTNLSNPSPLAPTADWLCRNTNPNDPASCFDGANGDPTTTALQFDPNGNLVPFDQGVIFSGTSNGGGDGFAFNDFAQITSDLERWTAMAFYTMNLTDNIELFLEGTHFRSRADELVQQPTFNANLFGGGSAELRFNVNSPFLTQQARDTLIARGVTTFQLSRASLDLADLTGFNETRIWRFVGGLRGDLTVMNQNWNWEVYGNWGVANSHDLGQNIHQQRFVNAVNNCQLNPGVNNVTPGFNPIADPNCQSLNLLGEGRASQAARDYVIQETEVRSRQEQWSVVANLGGTLWDLWGGGPLGFNIGYEHRNEYAKFEPDQFLQQGLGRSVAITPLTGQYNLDEVFGELLIPLVSPETGLSFIQSAQIFGRARYVHNTVNGGFYSWAVGGHLAPIEDIEFRGNFTRSFRSPAITELFLPIVNAFNTVPDLCSLANRNAGAVPAIRLANCTAFLAKFPNATPDPASTATVPVQSGGNTGLDNEKADSWTAGFILRPRFLPRFSMTADYISITINDPIANLTIAQVASGCFDNTEFDATDPANGNSFCSLIVRDPTTGRVVNNPATPAIRTGFVNGQEIKFRGIQGTMNYSIPIERWGMNGTFSVGGDMLYVQSRLNNITGVAPSRSDGIVGDPEFAGQLRLRYVEDTWGVNTTVNYTGEQVISRLNRRTGVAGSGPDAREIDEYDDYVTVNAGIWFDASRDFRLTLAVTNLFNRQGQEYFGELIPGSFNDLLGRRYAASARVRF
ncbi:MAG TPA: TonB-dependent receptor [Allosphingosinicella sp.]|nr:TonB-dependent receptor [Allosphingosinicella sp.]